MKLRHLSIYKKAWKALSCFQAFIIPKIEKEYSDGIDIIPEMGYTLLKRREGFYAYDSETGCGKMGD